MDKKLLFQDLVDALSESGEIKKKEADEFLKVFFDLLENGLLNEKLVKINNLGTFKLIEAEARNSVDVNTGESFLIKEHFKISFTPDQVLKDAVNKPFSAFEPVESTITDENTTLNSEDENLELPHTQSLLQNEKICEQNTAFPIGNMRSEAAYSGEDQIIENYPEAKLNEVAGSNKIIFDNEISETGINSNYDSDAPEILDQNKKDGLEKNGIINEISENCVVDEADSDIPDFVFSQEDSPLKSSEEYKENTALTDENQKSFLSKKEETQYVSEDKVDGKQRLIITGKRTRLIFFSIICIIGILIVVWSIISNLEVQKEIDQKNKIKELYIKEQTVKKEPVLTDSITKEQKDSLSTKKDTITQNKNKEAVITDKQSGVENKKTESTKQNIVNKNILPKTIIIHPGERLLDLSKKYYGSSVFWVYIYLDNKNVISDPNNVVVGTKILISKPDPSKINSDNPVLIDKAKKLQSSIFSEFKTVN